MLRPEDIDKKQFAVGMRGYYQKEVDDFLDMVRAAYADLYHNWKLRSDAPTQAIPTVPEQITQASKLLELAQQAAADQNAEAVAAKDKIVEGARASGKQIVQDAKAEATRLLEEATKEKHAEVGRLEDQRQKALEALVSLQNARDEIASKLKATLEAME
jgi:DivIVA domain-containing protein